MRNQEIRALYSRILIMAFLLIPLSVYANDSLPIFNGLGFAAFYYGTIWVLISELGYCLYQFGHTNLLRKCVFVIMANSITTAIGFVWMLIAPEPLAHLLDIFFPGTYEGVIRGVPEHNTLEIFGVMLMFLTGYISTAPIEAVVLHLFMRNTEHLNPTDSLKYSALLNAISYAGLVILYFVFLALGWNTH